MSQLCAVLALAWLKDGRRQGTTTPRVYCLERRYMLTANMAQNLPSEKTHAYRPHNLCYRASTDVVGAPKLDLKVGKPPQSVVASWPRIPLGGLPRSQHAMCDQANRQYAPRIPLTRTPRVFPWQPAQHGQYHDRHWKPNSLKFVRVTFSAVAVRSGV